MGRRRGVIGRRVWDWGILTKKKSIAYLIVSPKGVGKTKRGEERLIKARLP